MTSGRGEAILALARELRHAVATRQETMEQALRAYNHAGGYRLDYAAAFLTAMQRADAAYEECSREALETYRESFEQK
jgi:inorganic triphosphatase YgiF